MRIAETENIALGNFPRYAIESLGLVVLSAAAFILIKNDPNSKSYVPLLGIFALASQKLIPAMQQIYSGWAGVLARIESLNNTYSILAKDKIIIRDLSVIKPYNLKKNFQLKSVDFKYEGSSEFALKNINLSIRKGEIIGIIGKTGVGKSTLLDILMTLMKPNNGSLFVDNNDVFLRSPKDTKENLFTIESWRKSIAHVPQNIFLSDNSIAKNIAFGIPDEKINMDKVRWTANIAQISKFVETLPFKYETKVGERGILLSGGQRQRIGIARALYQEASLLILDEATSSLDMITEKKVMNAIFESKKKITLIIVAHRLSTLTICERVINMESGKIKEVLSKIEFIEKFIKPLNNL